MRNLTRKKENKLNTLKDTNQNQANTKGISQPRQRFFFKKFHQANDWIRTWLA